MKHFVSALCFFITALHAFGQHGNEWIRYDQPYYKIPVAKEGIYRISYIDLLNAGLAPTVNPKNFQLFHRGTEHAIIVEGESDGQWNGSDFIEFYGKGNDGMLDSTLYLGTNLQPHRYYSLFSDTTSYFLTYGAVNGKRVVSFSASSAGLPEQPYHWCEKLLLITSSYSSGVDYGNVQQTFFDQGEGWTGEPVIQSSQKVYAIQQVIQTVPAAGKPSVEILLTGRGPMTHHVELYAGTRLLSTISFTGYQSYKHIQTLEWSDIPGDGTVNFTIKVSSAETDRVSAGYIRMLFPQEISMTSVSDKVLSIPENDAGLSYIKVQDPSPGTRLFDVTDPVGIRSVQTELSATLNAVIPATIPRKIFATSAFLSPAVKRISFRQISPALHNYIIITHRNLRRPSTGYTDPVKAYAEYRSLPEGGGYDTLIVNIDQLYDQFNFGERSPRAIFQFMKFLASVKMPSYLFLIGKGLNVNYGYGRNPAAFTLFQDLVPSAGNPGSDMAYTAGLGEDPFVPAVPTGRLTAMNPAEVASYLNKIKETESLPFNDLHRKRILHLSGGIEEDEPAWFKAILQGFETVAKKVYLGGQIQAISKQTVSTKVINIADEVNSGLGLITFFGHSAPTTTDFDIGLVTNPVMGYHNTGRYPVILMNGCDAGAFFLNASIFGENWINTPDKGAVGFIAHSAYGLVNSLQIYSTIFYQVAFGDSVFIKKGIGDVQREVARRFLSEYGNIPHYTSQSQQMVLLGDPALKIFGAKYPDYEIQKDNIFISSLDRERITAQTDSFLLNIPIRNFGIAKNEMIRVEIKRKINDNTELVYDSIIQSVLHSDTIAFLIHNPDHNGFGNNVFSIKVDADNLREELDETNNAVSFDYFIPLNGTKNLYPYHYSIVNSRDVNLSFQYSDPGSEAREYLIELDTVSTFTSPYLTQFKIAANLLGKQNVRLLAQDTLVYYWRTKIAQPLVNESVDWTTSSFSYINNGPEGWMQMHFAQFDQNAFSGLVNDAGLSGIRFEETVSDIAIKTFSATSGKPQDSISFKVNGVEFNVLNEGGACRNNTINLVAFDRKSTHPYAGIYLKWYELLYEYGGRRLLCGREPYVINSFTSSELVTGQPDLIQYVDNIHPGDSVVLFNMGDAGFSLWPESAIVKLGELGISPAQIADLQNGQPVIIFGRKGSAPGVAKVFHSPSPEPFLKINKTIAGRFTSGKMTSVSIGPAQRWDKVIVQFDETEFSDAFHFDIVGITPNGNYDTLKTNLTITTDISLISAQEYPELKIVFNTSDDINLTAVQIKKWLVLYEPVAEGLIFYNGPVSQQVLFEGQTMMRDFGFLNISGKVFADSLTVRYQLLNHDNPGSSSSFLRIKAPVPGDTTVFTLPFKTHLKGGINDVEVFVNPRIVQEKFFDNNAIRLADHLIVLTDRQDPVIDVTIDERHIVNGDFVSVNPLIKIRLWDETPYLLKKDTLGVDVFLSYPCASESCIFQRIHFSRDDVSWQGATEDSDFLINFSPANLSKGIYRLRIEAGDVNGNSSDTPYEISFQVDPISSVDVASPFPNPFEQETNFQINVTGESPPFHFTLQLLNLDGALVQEYSDSSAGLHIGKNLIRWNGMDDRNNSLPNGIYLYRWMIDTGEKVKFFYGKIVLIR